MLDPDLESVARAMAEYSSDRPWESRHPKNRAYWMALAETVMGLTPADPAFGYIMNRAHGRKAAYLHGYGEATLAVDTGPAADPDAP